MVVIIFSSPGNVSQEKLLHHVLPQLADRQVEIYHSIRKLAQRLRQPMKGDMVGLFIAASHEELAEILSMHPLLRHMKIVLILPDKSESSISKGHSLRPRYLGYIEDDFRDVTAVLGKMVHAPTAVHPLGIK